MSHRITHILADQAATEQFARQLAQVARAGDTLALSGDLGAGKSTFARAFIRAASGDPVLDVPSPTFTLVQTYDHADGTVIHHADLYRLEDENDVYDLGLEEERDNAIMLIEWPDRLPEDWRRKAFELSFSIDEAETDRRLVTIAWLGTSWTERLNVMKFAF